jgi:choline dehydrogenase-like flavoprotein
MALFDVIIIGSGPAGVFAAYQLRQLKVLILDVGYTASDSAFPLKNLYDLRREGPDSFDELIGSRFESLNNLDRPYKSPKLKAPLWNFVTQTPGNLPADSTEAFNPVLSYAKGGLANAWGAGVLRYNDTDLDGFPINASELAPYYEELTKHIGINGQRDDLSDYFGSTEHLQPPLSLSPNSADLISRYEKRRAGIRKLGVTIGRTRAAIITKNHRGRPAYQNLGQDFFQPNQRSIYHPGYTLDELIKEETVDYRPGFLVKSYSDDPSGVTVHAENLATRTNLEFRGKKLILAAGAINTARIVLSSNSDYTTTLPLLDNPVSFIPMINLRRLGAALPIYAFAGGELVALYQGPKYPTPVQASFYGLGAPLRTDLVSEFPLPFRSSLTAGKYLLPGLAMLQVFYPDRPTPKNCLRLNSNGSINFSYTSPPYGVIEKIFIKAFFKLGFISSRFICKYPGPGSSIHYAGCLPMMDRPVNRYQTDRFGKLHSTHHIYVADGANFSRLPSKNHTFTIMANAMRIAEHVKLRVTTNNKQTM